MSHRDMCHRLIAVMACLGVWAGSSASAAAEPGEGAVTTKAAEGPALKPRIKRPAPLTTWAEGPTVIDRAAALAWLDGLGPGAQVRLPVTIVRSPLGGVEHATVHGGPSTGKARAVTPDVLSLALDDGRLGISLADRLMGLCPDRAAPCAVWLEGGWRIRPIVEAPGPASGLIPFAISRVGGAVAEAPDTPLRVFRAGAKPEGPAR